MLPDKTIAQLVKYYYGWKKTRTRTSLMDRQARKLQSQREDHGGAASEANDDANAESEDEEVGKDGSKDKGEVRHLKKPKDIRYFLFCYFCTVCVVRSAV